MLLQQCHLYLKYVKTPITQDIFKSLSNETRQTVNYGIETIYYRVPFLWANLPPVYKLEKSLNIFKRKIKNWKGENCSCRLCKTYAGVNLELVKLFVMTTNVFFNNRQHKIKIKRFKCVRQITSSFFSNS